MRRGAGERPCNVCGASKATDAFSWYAYTTSAGNRSVRRDPSCKACVKDARAGKGNPEQSRSWRARNPERVAAYAATYRASPRGKAIRRALVIKRQLGVAVRTPVWADTDKIALLYAAAAELTETTGVPHEVDHVFPLQGKTVSGLHVHTNLQVLRRDLNRSKYNRFSEASCQMI